MKKTYRSRVILTTIWLHSGYIFTIFWLHFCFIPTAFWLYSDYILTIFRLHSDSIPTTFWLNSDFILTTFFLHSFYILTTFWIYSDYRQWAKNLFIVFIWLVKIFLLLLQLLCIKVVKGGVGIDLNKSQSSFLIETRSKTWVKTRSFYFSNQGSQGETILFKKPRPERSQDQDLCRQENSGKLRWRTPVSKTPCPPPTLPRSCRPRPPGAEQLHRPSIGALLISRPSHEGKRFGKI